MSISCRLFHSAILPFLSSEKFVRIMIHNDTVVLQEDVNIVEIAFINARII